MSRVLGLLWPGEAWGAEGGAEGVWAARLMGDDWALLQDGDSADGTTGV
ncbi:MAG: hypothetical protein MUE66_09345 [Acidimicrobiia bacterium]|nr:hypothetical protein [Acidimicrobiia bacterium]